MKNQKFIMRDKSGNYSTGHASYSSRFYNAKIYEGNPKDYEQFENEIILLDSERGLELIAREIESLDGKIDNVEYALLEMKKGRENFYENSEELRKYIRLHNKCIHPILGMTESTRQKIIKDVLSK